MDIVLSFRRSVISDIFSAHVSSDPSGAGRRIEHPQGSSEPEVSVSWDPETLELGNGSVQITAPIRAAVRTFDGRRLSVEGPAVASMVPKLIYRFGAPHLSLDLGDVSLSNCVLTSADGGDPSGGHDVREEGTAFHNVVRERLFGRFVDVPLSYDVGCLAFAVSGTDGADRMPRPSPQALEPYTIAARSAGLVVQGPPSDVVAIGINVTDSATDDRPITAPAQREGGNASLRVGEAGLNAIVSQLLPTDVVPSLRWEPKEAAWVRFTSIDLALTDRMVSIKGAVGVGSRSLPLEAALFVSLDETGRLQTDVKRYVCDIGTANDIDEFFGMLMRILFRAGADANMNQTFKLPGSDDQVTAVSKSMIIEEGFIELVYEIPVTAP